VRVAVFESESHADAWFLLTPLKNYHRQAERKRLIELLLRSSSVV